MRAWPHPLGPEGPKPRFGLDKNGNKLREHISEDCRRNRLDKPRVPSAKINDPRLIASHDPCGFRSRQLHRKPKLPGKLPTTRDRYYYRQLRRAIKSGLGYDQDRPTTALLVPSGRIE